MIQINLLPVRVRRTTSSGRQFIYVSAFALVAAISTLGYLWYAQEQQIGKLNKRLAQIQQEVKNYSKFETLLKDLQQKKDTLDKKRSVIESLKKDRDTLVRIMALLSVQVPEGRIWFEKLNQSGNSILLDGIALSNESIAEFLRNLESSPYIVKGSVNLTHSRQTTISNMKLREFQISYRFLPFSEVQAQLKAKES